MTTYDELQSALMKYDGLKAEIDVEVENNYCPGWDVYPTKLAVVQTITIKDLCAHTTVVTILGDRKLIFHKEVHLSTKTLGKLLDLLNTPEDKRRLEKVEDER